MYRKPFILLLFLSCIALLGCGEKNTPDEQPVADTTGIRSEKLRFTVDTIARLNSPWGMAFLPDGRILVTEKAGAIRIIENGKLLDESVQGVPPVYYEGQGGLLDIQLHPDYSQNGWIYFSYAKPVGNSGATTLARARLHANSLTDLEELFQAYPPVNSGLHFGSRIAFDHQGHVFVTCGERGTKDNSQKLENHLGKVMRLHDDGSVPEDNPFVKTAGAKPEIWSYGHRNLQGLYYDTATDILWEHEHGPKGGDELNIIKKGKNYGWPVITYGIDYDGSIISEINEKEGMEQPVTYWVPSIAPCGLTMVKGDVYPAWRDNLLVGALALTHVARVEIDQQGKYVGQEKLLEKIGRVRAIAQSPDGYIFVATESPGMLVRLIPLQ